MAVKRTTRILCIPDLHAPYHHPRAVPWLIALADQFRPDRVVCLGDEIDAHAVSRWPADPDLDAAGPELTRGVEALRPLYARFGRVLVCRSNHTYRPWIRAREAGLPARTLRTPREVLDAPKGWEWADSHTLDGILFLHGEGFSGPLGALRCAVANRSRVVIGHLHGSAGVVWAHGRRDAIWGMNAGCLIDPDSPAFAYGRTLANRPSLGAGLIEDGIPRWVPLTL